MWRWSVEATVRPQGGIRLHRPRLVGSGRLFGVCQVLGGLACPTWVRMVALRCRHPARGPRRVRADHRRDGPRVGVRGRIGVASIVDRSVVGGFPGRRARAPARRAVFAPDLRAAERRHAARVAGRSARVFDSGDGMAMPAVETDARAMHAVINGYATALIDTDRCEAGEAARSVQPTEIPVVVRTRDQARADAAYGPLMLGARAAGAGTVDGYRPDVTVHVTVPMDALVGSSDHRPSAAITDHVMAAMPRCLFPVEFPARRAVRPGPRRAVEPPRPRPGRHDLGGRPGPPSQAAIMRRRPAAAGRGRLTRPPGDHVDQPLRTGLRRIPRDGDSGLR